MCKSQTKLFILALFFLVQLAQARHWNRVSRSEKKENVAGKRKHASDESTTVSEGQPLVGNFSLKAHRLRESMKLSYSGNKHGILTKAVANPSGGKKTNSRSGGFHDIPLTTKKLGEPLSTNLTNSIFRNQTAKVEPQLMIQNETEPIMTSENSTVYQTPEPMQQLADDSILAARDNAQVMNLADDQSQDQTVMYTAHGEGENDASLLLNSTGYPSETTAESSDAPSQDITSDVSPIETSADYTQGLSTGYVSQEAANTVATGWVSPVGSPLAAQPPDSSNFAQFDNSDASSGIISAADQVTSAPDSGFQPAADSADSAADQAVPADYQGETTEAPETTAAPPIYYETTPAELVADTTDAAETPMTVVIDETTPLPEETEEPVDGDEVLPPVTEVPYRVVHTPEECPEEIENLGCYNNPSENISLFPVLITKREKMDTMEQFLCKCANTVQDRKWYTFALDHDSCYSGPDEGIYDKWGVGRFCFNDRSQICSDSDTYCQGMMGTSCVYSVITPEHPQVVKS